MTIIGSKIELKNIGNLATVNEITNIVPVSYKDDGDESWYEVCDATKTDLIAIIGKESEGNDIIVVFNKKNCDISLLLDLL